ncbi:Lipoprotein [Vibrio tubiashii]|uniref:Lipoprotein n=1 Tax=Vibrio tubiashii ATCC 19109 TaxID=1051646 RepID=F9TC07_9VIBR|nr:hypothetical protein [Vibrio tubiashii]AIW16069.1 hypothetical protein IX91_18385 [Vibrio tubiashii ATCC 19109]EGU48425.1 hypothetical protein VITU9109_14863 [Vibrio tubiashii ATCC 19109]EIF03593.1 hypothetical protein VT1337_13047 [Vibrio tubiashii NCIMB 1337 = ATCC 19106]
MKTTVKSLLVAIVAASTLGGCSIYNDVQGARQLVTYDVTSNDSIYNAPDGNQYTVAKHRFSDGKVLTCYNDSGIFGSKEEAPLRAATNDWLAENQPGKIAGESNKLAGIVDAKICYEFVIAEPQPIGAYLDEETGEVVIVGEQETAPAEDEQLQPIGAYLDEETGDVVVVGEHDTAQASDEDLQPIGAYLDEETGDVVVVGESQ